MRYTENTQTRSDALCIILGVSSY